MIFLQVFYSNHYAGKDVYLSFRNGEAWKKVYGPFMVYVNSVSPEEDQSRLWVDAKAQVLLFCMLKILVVSNE